MAQYRDALAFYTAERESALVSLRLPAVAADPDAAKNFTEAVAKIDSHIAAVRAAIRDLEARDWREGKAARDAQAKADAGEAIKAYDIFKRGVDKLEDLYADFAHKFRAAQAHSHDHLRDFYTARQTGTANIYGFLREVDHVLEMDSRKRAAQAAAVVNVPRPPNPSKPAAPPAPPNNNLPGSGQNNLPEIERYNPVAMRFNPQSYPGMASWRP